MYSFKRIEHILLFYFLDSVFGSRRPSLMVQDPEYLKYIFVKNHQDFPNRNVRISQILVFCYFLGHS